MADGEQIYMPDIQSGDRRLPLDAWEALVERLEKRSHGSPEMGKKGSPRVYWLAGTYPQLIAAPKCVPRCPGVVAHRMEFGSGTDGIFGRAIAAWSLQGRELPAEGHPFYALCTLKKQFIGMGRVSLFDGEVVALLNTGRAGDFLPHATDAYGLILVFCWPRYQLGAI